jgi:hypothetical protein
MTIYSWYEAWTPGQFPTILGIGDSWFWYPKANNLMDGLVRNNALKLDYRNMVRVGQNGALLADYVDVPGRPGQFSKQLQTLITPDNIKTFAAVMVSGAGNDALDYSIGLNSDCSGATSADDCISQVGMGQLMKTVNQSVGLLLNEVITAFVDAGQSPHIFLNTYDYAVPDGRGFDIGPAITVAGPWLKKAMDDRRVPGDMGLRRQIVHILIDRLAAIFNQYQSDKNGIYVIDSRGTLSSDPANYQDDWDNELHPTSSGFDKIINQHWIPTFRQLGLAD